MAKINPGTARAIKFIERLNLVGDFLGKPFKLQPFQKHILDLIFRTDKKGKRAGVNRIYLQLPRSSGKSTLISAIVLYWMIGLGKKGQNCFSVAVDATQSKLIYEACAQMLAQAPELRSGTSLAAR